MDHFNKQGNSSLILILNGYARSIYLQHVLGAGATVHYDSSDQPRGLRPDVRSALPCARVALRAATDRAPPVLGTAAHGRTSACEVGGGGGGGG